MKICFSNTHSKNDNFDEKKTKSIQTMPGNTNIVYESIFHHDRE